MAKHGQIFKDVEAVMAGKNVYGGKNIDKLLDTSSEVALYNSQQLILNQMVHACDVSTATREPEVFNTWTDLLYEEFWQQGDLERQMGLPVSFLCDRNTASVPSSQAGFIRMFTLPLFQQLLQLCPALEAHLKAAKRNEQLMDEEDKKAKEQKTQ